MLDTNTISYIVRNSPPQVLERYAQVPPSSLAISVIVEATLLYGLVKNPGARAAPLLRGLLLRTQIVPWTSQAAARYATLRAERERLGRPIAELDLQIAAHALAAGARLVTSDRAFHDIPGLICEDWSRP